MDQSNLKTEKIFAEITQGMNLLNLMFRTLKVIVSELFRKSIATLN